MIDTSKGFSSWDNRDSLTPPDDPLEDMTDEEYEDYNRMANSDIERWARLKPIPELKPITRTCEEGLAALERIAAEVRV